MNIEIWTIGKPNDAHIEQGIKEYFKKTKPYTNISLHIIPPIKKMENASTDQVKKAEEALLLKRITPQHYIILLDERGKMFSATEWANQFQQILNLGTKTIVFVIGGAFGVTEEIRNRAQICWSLSKLVFPHQLVRLILAEQIYRTYSILNHLPYHHE